MCSSLKSYVFNNYENKQSSHKMSGILFQSSKISDVTKKQSLKFINF